MNLLPKVPIKIGGKEIAKAELTIDNDIYPGVVTSVIVVEYRPKNQSLIEKTVREKFNLSPSQYVFFSDEKA